MRTALHAHILAFFKSRETRADFKPLPALERIVPGHEPRQRPRDSNVPPLDEWQADNVYQTHHVGPIIAEMVRPNVSGTSWGGYDVEKLRIAGLARAIQQRLPYCHPCNPLYCLKDRTACRFFFPWPYSMEDEGGGVVRSSQSQSKCVRVSGRVCKCVSNPLSSIGISPTSVSAKTPNELPCRGGCLKMTNGSYRTICI